MAVNSVKCICDFVKQYRAGGIPREIYQRTDYGKRFSKITQEEIAAVIEDHPELIDDWLAFTADKRWSPAWGLTRGRNWQVIYTPKGGGPGYCISYSTPAAACALLIRMEMEELRLSAPASGS